MLGKATQHSAGAPADWSGLTGGGRYWRMKCDLAHRGARWMGPERQRGLNQFGRMVGRKNGIMGKHICQLHTGRRETPGDLQQYNTAPGDATWHMRPSKGKLQIHK